MGREGRKVKNAIRKRKPKERFAMAPLGCLAIIYRFPVSRRLFCYVRQIARIHGWILQTYEQHMRQEQDGTEGNPFLLSPHLVSLALEGLTELGVRGKAKGMFDLT